MPQENKTTVRVNVRLEDLGPAGHVGNASVVAIIEEARMFFLGHPIAGKAAYNNGVLEILQGRAQMLIAAQTVEYVGEMFYSLEPLHVTFWIGHIGGASATLCGEIRVTADGDPIVKTEATMVMTSDDTGRPWQMPDDVRAHLANYQAAPVVLRPRPGQA